jgi:hypothetical protein
MLDIFSRACVVVNVWSEQQHEILHSKRHFPACRVNRMTGSGGPPKPAAQPGKKGRQVLSPLITEKKDVVAVPPGSFMPAAHFYPRVLNAVCGSPPMLFVTDFCSYGN